MEYLILKQGVFLGTGRVDLLFGEIVHSIELVFMKEDLKLQ